MGEPAQARIVRKLDLERFLTTIPVNPSPQASLEQYTISEHVAADILYLAAYANGDIVGKTILDLGCGTGRLALGAAFLGAKTVIGVDVDKQAVDIAAQNARSSGFNTCTSWVNGDIDAIVGRFDTVVQNPPFGVQKRGADRKFLSKALEVGTLVYSLHNHPETDELLLRKLKKNRSTILQVEPSPFIKRYVEEHGAAILGIYALSMPIPRLFEFHTKAKYDIIIDLYVIKKKSDNQVQ